MASNLMHHKGRVEDRISGLPDALVCRILSFLFTREAVKTSVLSRRWKNVWTCVPVLDLDEEEYEANNTDQPSEYNPEWFPQFVTRVLLYRCPGDIDRFRLFTNGQMEDVSIVYVWICTAIKRNVVELDLTINTPSDPCFEIPKSLFMCSTLVRFKLWLHNSIRVMTPTSSNCFPSLKFLHVDVRFPHPNSMEKLSSCLPVLEELIIHGDLQWATAFNLDISAPKLKRLQIELRVFQYFYYNMYCAAKNNLVNFVCQIFFNVDAPNIQELDICFDALVSFSMKNAKCLRKAKIGFFNVKELENHDCLLDLADRIRQIFAGICDAKYLTVDTPILTALDVGHQHLLPTFNKLNYLELQLHTCRSLQSLETVLKMSPHLEHLKISRNRKQMYPNVDEGELEPGWDEPESVPVCLISHIKTICLWDFQGCPDDMEVAMYLVKHGKALKKVTIYNHFCQDKEVETQSPIPLWSKFSKFPRGSKTCKIQFQTII